MVNDIGAVAWPPVEFEPRPWVRSGDEVASRRQLRAAAGDYRAAVVPLIASRTMRLDSEVLALADDASKELTRFDAEAGMVVAPFAAVLLRTESASSSEVENVTASAKQVALAEIGAARSGNADLVVGNVRAMTSAIDLADRLDEDAIIAMHDALLAASAPNIVGHWRDQQVWIGGGSISPHHAAFVPPHHERVPRLMSDLIEFAHRTDIPALVQAAIAHAQFETIHPFPDGNGRTGRALLQGMFRAAGVTQNVAVPVSAGLLSDLDGYFGALTRYREGDPAPIVATVAQAAFSAITNGRSLVQELQAAIARWRGEVTARSDSSVFRLMEHLLRQPVVNTKSVAEALEISQVAAQTSIDQLVNVGVLTKTAGGARYRMWQATEILAALDAFASRARRNRP